MKLFDRIIFSKKKLFKACFSIHSCFVSLVQKVSDAGLTSVISISITSKSDKHTWLLYSFKCSFIVNNIIKTYILEKALLFSSIYYVYQIDWRWLELFRLSKMHFNQKRDHLHHHQFGERNDFHDWKFWHQCRLQWHHERLLTSIYEAIQLCNFDEDRTSIKCRLKNFSCLFCNRINVRRLDSSDGFSSLWA